MNHENQESIFDLSTFNQQEQLLVDHLEYMEEWLPWYETEWNRFKQFQGGEYILSCQVGLQLFIQVISMLGREKSVNNRVHHYLYTAYYTFDSWCMQRVLNFATLTWGDFFHFMRLLFLAVTGESIRFSVDADRKLGGSCFVTCEEEGWSVWGGGVECVRELGVECVRGRGGVCGYVNRSLSPGESWGSCRRDDFRSRLSRWSQWTREVVGCASGAILVDNRTVDERYNTISCLIIKRHVRVRVYMYI